MAEVKRVTIDGLRYFKTKQDAANDAKFVAKETGKSLLLDTEATRLSGMETGAQVNVIETVKVNDVPLTVTSGTSGTKAVNIDLSEYAKSADLTTVYRVMGTVANYADLPANASVGDVYNITNADSTNGIKAGDNVVKTSTGWDNLAGITDLSAYLTIAAAGTTYVAQSDITAVTNAEIDELFDDGDD